jgi:thioesterase domain-containing protein
MLSPAGTDAGTPAALSPDGDHFDLAARRYVPLPCRFPVVLFRAQSRSLRISAGWRYLAHGGLAIIPVNCEHHEILEEPHVRGLAVELRRLLDEAQARDAASRRA